MVKKIVRLKYLFTDNGPEAFLNPRIVRGIFRESLEYGKDPDAEYIPENPSLAYIGSGTKVVVEEERKRGDGFD